MAAYKQTFYKIKIPSKKIIVNHVLLFVGKHFSTLINRKVGGNISKTALMLSIENA